MYRIHATLHKCLTMYYIRVMGGALDWLPRRRQRFTHVESIQGLLYNQLDKYRVISCSGFAIDIARLDDDFRIVRFVRDPRDLIVSGYFYHKRSAEPWFRMRSPTEEYWQAINGRLPAGMPSGPSYAEYLQSLDREAGLLAEMEFRDAHLQSLREWPDDERIQLIRYESILGNERKVFSEIADFYELGRFEQARIARLADRYSSRRRSTDKHIRNPQPAQWREHFTPAVEARFRTTTAA